MKLSYHQLPTHLKNNLAPIYLVTGNEPLLMQECRDSIRSKAQQQGFSEIERFDITKDFDWSGLIEATNSLSLFSNKRFIEIKLNHKPNVQGSKLFIRFIENLSPDNIVLVLSEKLDSTAQKSSWVNAINKTGTLVTIWPLDSLKFQQWVEKRLRDNNLRCDKNAVQFLVEQTEGNLLACAQEIEKLALLFSERVITRDDMVSAIADSARYDVFNFIDILFEGNVKRTIRVLHKLQKEAVEPTLLLWVITREIRLLINVIFDLKNKNSWEAIVKKHQIWDKKQHYIKKVIQLPIEKDLHQMLLQAEKIDHIIKGLQIGSVWVEIEKLIVSMSLICTQKSK